MCSTGGVFQGRALGNAINIGDAAEVWEEMDVFREGLGQKQVKGNMQTMFQPLEELQIKKQPFLK